MVKKKKVKTTKFGPMFKKGKKKPVNMLEKMKGDTALMKKRKMFAKNAKKWHHA